VHTNKSQFSERESEAHCDCLVLCSFVIANDSFDSYESFNHLYEIRRDLSRFQREALVVR